MSVIWIYPLLSGDEDLDKRVKTILAPEIKKEASAELTRDLLKRWLVQQVALSFGEMLTRKRENWHGQNYPPKAKA